MRLIKRILLGVVLFFAGTALFSQSFPWYSLGIPITPDNSSEAEDFIPEEEVSVEEAAPVEKTKKDDNSLVHGLESYRSKDWISSTIFLRRALSSKKNSSADILYMLIMSEMYSGDYEAAVVDCDTFLASYPNSTLVRNIQYQKGRALHYTGQNDQSVIILSDFCHQNPDSRMYPSALYWIAECFYEDYNFDTARSLYEQIVTEYPNDKKAVDAKFKLDAIVQREREQKLLMLLKETGEEYVSSRETYERQIKEYETQDIVSLRRQLNEANARIAELEKAEAEAKLKPAVLPSVSEVPAKTEVVVSETPVVENAVFVTPANNMTSRKGISVEELLELKIRAAQLQRLLDEKYSASAEGEGDFYE